MRRLILLAAALSAILASPALASQDDERLDALFARLVDTNNVMEARVLEGQIWTIWHESGSDTVDLLMQDGIIAMRRGDLERAVRQFTHVIDLAPDFAEGWNKRATVYFMMQNFPASVADIAKTLELEPRHFGALSGLGLIYDATEDDEGALKAYRKAVAVNPHLPHARRRIEEIEREIKDRDI